MPTSASVKGSRSHVLICAEFGGEDLMQTVHDYPRARDADAVRCEEAQAERGETADQAYLYQQCHAGLTWTLTSCFRGRWISAPDATSRASNKVLQLSVATKNWLLRPETWVSQSRSEAMDFTTGDMDKL